MTGRRSASMERPFWTSPETSLMHIATSLLFMGSGGSMTHFPYLRCIQLSWLDLHKLRLLHATILFERGRLGDVRTALQALRQTKDSPDARQLQINLAIVSGDWESLQGFVESEWNARGDRTPSEMLRAGQIAQHIGVARGKELVQRGGTPIFRRPRLFLSVATTRPRRPDGKMNLKSINGWNARPNSLATTVRSEG